MPSAARPAHDLPAFAVALANSVRERHQALVGAAVAELGLPAIGVGAEADYTAEYLEHHFAARVGSLVLQRHPVAVAHQEALLMLPSNQATWVIADIARAAAPGNRVRARMTGRAARLSRVIQQVFDAVCPGIVTMDIERSGPEFLTYGLGSPDVPFLMVWGGEQLGDELLTRSRSAVDKKIVFEGPGKDPAIVLPGVNPAAEAKQIVEAKFTLGGQQCIAPENFLLHRSVHDEIVERLVAACDSATVGDPRDPRTDIGPLLNSTIADTVRSQLEDAKRLGADVVVGGRIDDLVVHPTVVTGVTPEMTLFQDETFAPVFAVAAYDDVDEAITLARNSRFGLRASVSGPGAEAVAALLRGAEYAEAVPSLTYGRFGMIGVGEYADLNGTEAFGGYGKSGWVWSGGTMYQGPKSIAREASTEAGSIKP